MSWSDPSSAALYDAIAAALYPFKATGVILTLSDVGFPNFRTLEIEIRNLPSCKFRVPLDYESIYADDCRLYVAEQAYLALCDVPQITPPDNVILGEN